MSEGKQTKLVTAGRDEKWTNGVVNPPVQRASTVVFNTCLLYTSDAADD